MIEEIGEYWFSYWIGPFVILLAPPVTQGELSHFLTGLNHLLDKLWALTLEDPTADTINLLIQIQRNPAPERQL